MTKRDNDFVGLLKGNEKNMSRDIEQLADGCSKKEPCDVYEFLYRLASLGFEAIDIFRIVKALYHNQKKKLTRDILIMRVLFYFIIGLLVIAGALYLTTNFWEVV